MGEDCKLFDVVRFFVDQSEYFHHILTDPEYIYVDKSEPATEVKGKKYYPRRKTLDYRHIVLKELRKISGYETMEAFLSIGSELSTSGPAFRRPTPGLVELHYYDTNKPNDGKPHLSLGSLTGPHDTIEIFLGSYFIPAIVPATLAEDEAKLNPPGYPPSYNHLKSPEDFLSRLNDYLKEGKMRGIQIGNISLEQSGTLVEPRILVVDEVQLPVLEFLARAGYQLERVGEQTSHFLRESPG